MPKLSSGILLYRYKDKYIEVFLVHPGGPFWAKKDLGAWSLPKGEYASGEDQKQAARREFKEETGFDAPNGAMRELGDVKYSNKIVTVWALEGSVDARRIQSNTFTMEWPPKTGKQQEFAEVDRAGWFSPVQAKQKLVKGQVELIDRLCDMLGVEIDDDGQSAQQMSLL